MAAWEAEKRFVGDQEPGFGEQLMWGKVEVVAERHADNKETRVNHKLDRRRPAEVS